MKDAGSEADRDIGLKGVGRNRNRRLRETKNPDVALKIQWDEGRRGSIKDEPSVEERGENCTQWSYMRFNVRKE